MHKKNIYIVVCLMVVIIVFGSYKLFNSKNQREARSESDTEQKQENSNENGKELIFGSMQDVLTHRKPLKCTYSDVSNEGAEVTGIIYVADNKRRTEFETTEKETDKKLKMNSLFIEKWMYSWSNSAAEGMKMNLKKMLGDEQFEKYFQGEADSMKKKIDYKCQAWIPDNSKFSVPADIKFKDIN